MHTHGHAASDHVTSEKGEALLAYMLDHNKHHADELHDLAHSLPEESAALVHDAVDLLNESNEKLALALEKLHIEAEEN